MRQRIWSLAMLVLCLWPCLVHAWGSAKPLLTNRWFEVDGIEIHYMEGPPSGPPLILLHGLSDDWTSFRPLIPTLVSNWHVHAVDLRGHGKSGHSDEPYTTETWARDVTALIKAKMRGEQVILFGHSLGGFVSAVVAADSPELVRAVILGDTPPFAPDREEKAGYNWAKMVHGLITSTGSAEEAEAAITGHYAPRHTPTSFMTSPVRARHLAAVKSQVDPEIFSRFMAYYETGDTTFFIGGSAVLPKITAPTLLLQTTAVSDEDAQRALDLLPRGYHMKLENSTHHLGMDRWDVQPLLRILMTFLGTV